MLACKDPQKLPAKAKGGGRGGGGSEIPCVLGMQQRKTIFHSMLRATAPFCTGIALRPKTSNACLCNSAWNSFRTLTLVRKAGGLPAFASWLRFFKPVHREPFEFGTGSIPPSLCSMFHRKPANIILLVTSSSKSESRILPTAGHHPFNVCVCWICETPGSPTCWQSAGLCSNILHQQNGISFTSSDSE